MTPLLIYFLKVNLALGILFLAYYFLLRKEKFFHLNRIILLSIIGLAFLLPLLPAIEGSAGSRLDSNLSGISPFNSIGPFREDKNNIVVPPPPSAGTNPQFARDVAPRFTIITILAAGYMIIVTILMIRLLFQLFRVYGMIKRSRREKIGGTIFCYHGLDVPPFSFFRWLVFNKDLYPPAEEGQIIAHEQVHIRQGHSVDLLLAEFLHALCWINPLLIGFKRAVRLNLEYIADEKVIDTGVDIRAYQYSILRNLEHPGLPLVNEFSSSKIKLRIHMINKKTSPTRNLYKYALALPLLAGAYLIVTPLKARSAPVTANRSRLTDNRTGQPDREDLKSFEGYYQASDNKDSYIRIRVNGDHLVLVQMWDDHEITFDQSSPMEFSTLQGRFPLKFSKDANGVITEVLAMDRDRWIKVKDYSGVSYITLPSAQLKTFEGYYETLNKDGKMLYLQIEATADGLLLRQGWDGLEFPFRPTSATSFFCKKVSFAMEFTKGNNGTVTEMTALHKDHWKKMSDPSTAIIKRGIKLDAAQLKKLEGEYHLAGGTNDIHIEGREGHLVLTQRWDGQEIDLYASSPTEFFSKINHFPVVFTVDKDGIATETLIVDRDRWVKIK